MEYMNHKKSFTLLEEQNRSFARDKERPIKGYLKLETSGSRGAVRVGVHNLMYFEKGIYIYKLILFGKKNEKTIYKIAGDLVLDNQGRGETYLNINPSDMDGSGNKLDQFTIATVAAVSMTDSREPLHPVLRGTLEEKSVCRKAAATSYNAFYNQYVLQCCSAIEDKKELYNETLPFKTDRTGAEWRHIVNLGKFPIISPGAHSMMARYRHFIFGISKEYYYAGVPGRYLEKEQPDAGKSGFVLWQPIMGAEGYHADREDASEQCRQVAYGYWIAAINRKNGSIEQVHK